MGGDSEFVSVSVKGSLQFSGGVAVIEFVKNVWDGGRIVGAFGERYGGEGGGEQVKIRGW